MTSPEPSNETDEVLTTPATPGAEALPTTEDDESGGSPPHPTRS
jgi:hypothetical protein